MLHSSFLTKIERFKLIANYYSKLPPALKKLLTTIIFILVVFIVLNIVFPLKIDIQYSPIVLAKDSTLINAYLTYDDKWRMYTELEEITPELKKAIVFKEDRFFYYHFGINPVAIVRASINNIRYHRRTSGASTITMQVARLISPKERSYWNKITEMFRASQLEWKYSKNEILQIYLNIIPFGSNIEGVKAASVIYFGKLPNHLSLAEITALSIIPNRPVSLRLGTNNEYIVKERNKWLNRYKKAKLFDLNTIDDALTEPLNAYRRSVPHLAPHLSYRLKTENTKSRIIRSTINLEMQKKCESIIKTYSNGLYFQNIKNAMAIVIDNKSREVIAYIGSADYYNNEDGGQVDGIRSIRSPGSTLKPLAYALAFDAGIVTPKTIISDVPVSFSGYEPENYDEKFYGNISIEKALASSLNVPAVKILSELKTATLLNALIQANFAQIGKDKENLGLSIVLGGCGVSLEELANLYCTLANGGSFSALKYLKDNHGLDTIRIVSQGAAYMVTDILTQLERPDLPLAWENSQHTPKIAWKTGTSYGRKDAWSIGYNNKYTVGVWVGNFSAQGVPELSGAEKATPLLFRIFNAIDYNTNLNWFTMPPDIDLRYVCSQSGLLPEFYCNNLILNYYLPNKTNNKKCQHSKLVIINPDSTMSYCLNCRPEFGYIEALYPNLAPEVITYYNTNQIKYSKIPPHNPECERLIAGLNPKITSPVSNNEYYVNVNEDMEIMLSCHVANDVENVYWYINNKFLKAAGKEEKLFFKPDEGTIEISCSDDKGRNSSINIIVKYTDM
jgi:penicillin-binding protein 1C